MQTTLTVSQYSVVLNSVPTGGLWSTSGVVTTTTNYSSGTITIQRVLPYQQLTTISNQGDFLAQVVEEALDQLCMQVQQVANRTGSYRGVWSTGNYYNFGDIVQDGANGAYTNNIYVCSQANTAGVWATDEASGYWQLALNVQTLSATAGYLPLSGGTISGNLVVSGNEVIGQSLTVTGSTYLASLATCYNGLTVSSGALTASGTVSGSGFTSLFASPPAIGGTAAAAGSFTSMNGGQLAGLRNRTINGDMRIDQRNAGASQTITAAASAAYTVDRFYATCTGANVTGQRVTGTSPDQYAYQFTGASSVTAIAFGQRYEATNVYDLASTTATFSVRLANSLLTTVTWTAYYPASTDTWSSRTSIATGTFTVSSTPAKYSVQISLPSNVTTGLEIELTVGAQTSGTWTITEFQLENGSVATPFERRPIGLELALCQRYYWVLGHYMAIQFYSNGSGSNAYMYGNFPVLMRATPTMTTSFSNGYNNGSTTFVIGADGFMIELTAAGSGQTAITYNSSNTASAEL